MPPPSGIALRVLQPEAEHANLAALAAACRAGPGRKFLLRDGSGRPLAEGVAPGPPDPGLEPLATLGPAHWRGKAVFLDRDGTVMENRHYLREPAGVSLLSGAAEGLRALASQGLAVAVLTNQSGIGRGLITPEELAAVHARLTSILEERGIRLAGIFTCPHHPDAGCACRKPATGLAVRAAEACGISPREALVVGDHPADLRLARTLGVPAVLVTTGYGGETLASAEAQPDFVVDSLVGLAGLLGHPDGLPLPAPGPEAAGGVRRDAGDDA